MDSYVAVHAQASIPCVMCILVGQVLCGIHSAYIQKNVPFDVSPVPHIHGQEVTRLGGNRREISLQEQGALTQDETPKLSDC